MRILVIDDDTDQRYLLERAFRSAMPKNGIVHSLSGGEEAIRYLGGEGIYADRAAYPFPSLIITDLNMPEGDGFSVLEFLRHNPAWSVVPRVVLSSSDDDDDVKTAYLVGATAYHQKPASMGELMIFAQTLVHYWMSCHVPPVDEHGRAIETQHLGKLGERFPHPHGGGHMLPSPADPAVDPASSPTPLKETR